METKFTFMVLVVGVAIFGSALAIFAMTELQPQLTKTANDGKIGFLGHVTLTVYDAEGNIKKYIQGDNEITNQGNNCIAVAIFGATDTTGDNDCISPTTFNDIVIGVDAATTDDDQANALQDTLTQKTALNVNVVLVNANTANGIATVTLIGTFTDPGAETFTQSGITDGDDFLAIRSFSTSATLGATDDLVVTWTIIVGP